MSSPSHMETPQGLLSPEIYQEIFQRANDAILIFRPDDEVILAANLRAEELYGYTHEELIGMSLKAVTVNVERGEEALATLLRAGRYDNYETLHRHRDGSILFVLSNAAVIQFEGATAILTVNRDVTQTKQVEEELRQRSSHLTALIDGNPLGIVVLDCRNQIVTCNPAFSAIFQWREEELIGLALDDFVAPDDLKQEALSLTDTVLAGQPFRVTTRRRRKDDTLVDVEVMGVPLMIGNQNAGSFGLYQDISERVSLQHQLLESQKLEAIGRLAGGVAHDLNNMLTAVTIHAQLLHSKLTSQLQQHTQQICLAADRASSTVQQLLAFSRKQTSFPRVVPLNATISELMGMLRPLIREELELNYSPHSGELHVQIDPSHLAQALVNLVVNARDAIPGQGAISIRTSVRSFSPVAPEEPDMLAGEYAVVEVLDTGTGMTPEIKARIFEPFFTTKELGKGTGLGLATVYGIVKQNKGAIDVASKPGHGSSFRILLPLQPASAAGKSERKRPGLPSGTETILLVEDEDTARRAIAEFLEDLGYRVLQASNGRDALAAYQEKAQEIDSVVSDLIMPHMSGADLAREIWNLDPHLPILFVSAYGDEEVRSKLPLDCLFFQKPFHLEQLARTLRSKLGKGA